LRHFFLCRIGKYESGHFTLAVGYPWIALINSVSQTWAVYCLILFYHSLHEQIKEIRPLAKFLAIKLVLFFTFWQSVAIAFFVEMNYLHETHDYSGEQVASGVQDLLICLEMFVASLAHLWIFPWEEFYKGGDAMPHFQRIGSALNPRDLVNDMRDYLVKPTTTTKDRSGNNTKRVKKEK